MITMGDHSGEIERLRTERDRLRARIAELEAVRVAFYVAAFAWSIVLGWNVAAVFK